MNDNALHHITKISYEKEQNRSEQPYSERPYSENDKNIPQPRIINWNENIEFILEDICKKCNIYTIKIGKAINSFTLKYNILMYIIIFIIFNIS